MERYKKLMGIKKGKTMIELPRLNSVSVMTSNVGSTHMTPREDYVRLSDATTYGDQRAAEAREQMREECVKLIGKPVWLTWDVRAALITLIRKLS